MGPIVWADIPVTDIARAKEFYERVTQQPVSYMPGTDDTIALIGSEPVSADLYVGVPSHDGATVYLNTYGDIDGMLERVLEAGGKILDPKTFRGPMVGWIAFVEDSEGNRIGLQMPAKEA